MKDKLNYNEKIYLENELFSVINAFYDLDDKSKRKEYIKKYTEEFCKKNNIDLKIVLKEIDEIFNKRKNLDEAWNAKKYNSKEFFDIFEENTREDDIR